ncbi:MAG TPA: bifunctional (p)ppGpp synthetase/guanosine-3',5'-bis(diphosphate) 3'-pyrophosphohydrolase [Bacillota bacterium]|nr:bifunctional (p)ppGpp synthetase/guanosine-3',5'-bis(diphosphate) 3'-pyrophosphohydrolase [Bacillota bacterium]
MPNRDIKTIEQVMKHAKTYLLEEDILFIQEAYDYAAEAHAKQFRKSGEPYIVHPIQVASILVDLELDPSTIAGGFLHDVVEDTDITIEQIEETFGEEVAMLVDGVTKLGQIKYKSKEAQQAENHRKMFVAMAKDIRVILIKLADRLHNMRTLEYLPADKQRRISNETLEIFAPLAHRLGISTMKWELEDTSLRYLNPKEYYHIVRTMRQKRTEREAYIEDVIKEINTELDKVNIESTISGRPKHIYSIYQKMSEQDKSFDEIYDLLAVRVLVDSIKDCYAVLGIIHTCWKPMPGRFKDYIAMPKPNLYQSLHTTVMGPGGDPLEVQIRTNKMHEIAEYGIAAHWAYKEGKSASNQSFEEKLTWFREILEWQQEAHDAEEFMESLKTDLFSDMVYVFTPRGDVIELPAGSVPIDFAYRIHTEIGNQTVGAKVNGKIKPLDYKLQTGDIVEVVTSKQSYGPSQDWLKITRSSKAKNKIKQFFKKQRREENIIKGREAVEREIIALGYKTKDVLIEENLERVFKKFNFTSEDDMYAAVGYQGITASLIATRLTDPLRDQEEEDELSATLDQLKSETISQRRPSQQSATGVEVAGIDNLLVRLAKCCNPVPGDEIIGFITRGRGVSVHQKQCPNIQSEDRQERLLKVYWQDQRNAVKQYYVKLEITGFDRNGLLNDVLQAVNEMGTNITKVNGSADENNIANIQLNILIHNKNHLQKVVHRVKQVEDIYTVKRVLS